MKRPSTPGFGARAQRGVVLFIALIVLAAMTLASVALVRSVDTATLGAGNIAFKQSATQAAERAVAAAMAKFATLPTLGPLATGTTAQNHQAADNYCASLLPTDPRGVPLVLLGTPATVDTNNKACDSQPLAAANKILITPTQETLRYVIERLCPAIGAPNQDTCNVAQVIPGGGSGTEAHLGANKPLYRVTVRVDGPRNTLHFTQVVLRP